MASIECPYCHHKAVIEVHGSPVPGNMSAGPVKARIGRCPGCMGLVLLGYGGTMADRIVYVVPVGGVEDSDPLMPDGVRADLWEARTCFSVSAFKATATMCRRAVQSACVDMGASSATLQKQIDEVVAGNRVHASVAQWAHAIRLVGNSGAHPGDDGLDTVTGEEAEELLRFTEQFLELAYVVPKRVEAAMSRSKGVKS